LESYAYIYQLVSVWDVHVISAPHIYLAVTPYFSHHYRDDKVKEDELMDKAAIGPGVYSASNRNEYQRNNVSGE
jgi:hypothetical protein